jgi:ABC-type multidrug transport system fused ATPase/permease subunit
MRKAKVVIFDEATANIDVLTEQKILSLIKEEFKEASVITIAHRLNTIIKSDMVAVMSFGTLKEYDPPAVLLKRPDSDFAKLLNELEDS